MGQDKVRVLDGTAAEASLLGSPFAAAHKRVRAAPETGET